MGDEVSIARDGRGRGRGGRVCPDQRPVGAEGKMTKGGGTAAHRHGRTPRGGGGVGRCARTLGDLAGCSHWGGGKRVRAVFLSRWFRQGEGGTSGGWMSGRFGVGRFPPESQ